MSNPAGRLTASGVRIATGSQGLSLDLSPVAAAAGRLADAVDDAKAAWADFPPFVRERIGKIAVVLDTHPAGSGLRVVPVDMAVDEWENPAERWELT